MLRPYKVYIEDVLEAIKKIEKYTKGKNFDTFKKDSLLVDGIIRNLEIIGEAVKKIPDDVRKDYDDIEWKKICGLRDILIHEYFGINLDIIWDIVINKVPPLKKSIAKIKKELKE